MAYKEATQGKATAAPDPAKPKKKPGRPPGSKNKKKVVIRWQRAP